MTHHLLDRRARFLASCPPALRALYAVPILDAVPRAGMHWSDAGRMLIGPDAVTTNAVTNMGLQALAVQKGSFEQLVAQLESKNRTLRGAESSIVA